MACDVAKVLPPLLRAQLLGMHLGIGLHQGLVEDIGEHLQLIGEGSPQAQSHTGSHELHHESAALSRGAGFTVQANPGDGYQLLLVHLLHSLQPSDEQVLGPGLRVRAESNLQGLYVYDCLCMYM